MPHPRILKALGMTAAQWGEIPDGPERVRLKNEAMAKIKAEDAKDPLSNTSIHERMLSVETRMASLEARIASLDSSVSNISSANAAIESRLTAVETKVSELETGTGV